MTGKLAREIKQSKPFDSLESEALLNLVRASEDVRYAYDRFFRQWGLSGAQYNVLRILRGAGGPLTCRDIGERTVARVPDVTRLLDRLESRGLIERVRSTDDRRVVSTRIQPAGLALLSEIDEPIREINRSLIGHLEEAKLRQLIELLEEVRDAGASPSSPTKQG